MSEYDPFQVSEWLRDGIAAAKVGRRDEARALLMRVVEANERSAQGWLWLSGVVDTDQDRLICLENVLALEPENVRARAGLKWLQERGVVEEETARTGIEDSSIDVVPPRPEPDPAPGPFMTPDGCAYCGRVISEQDVHCPHCGGQLTTTRFKRKERSIAGYLLQPFWMVMAGVDLIHFFLIGYLWKNLENVSSLFLPYLPYLYGRAMTDPASVDAFVEVDVLVQIVRFTLLGLAVLAGLASAGLFLRIFWMHPLGLALVAVHLICIVLMFALGFSGFLFAAFQLALVALLTLFMFQSTDDFSRESVQERLEPDRHLINDVDYYQRGRVYAKRGMWAKALLHWQRAAAFDSSRDVYLVGVARAYANLGRFETALTHLDEAMRVSRTPEEWRPLREAILAMQGRGGTGVEMVRQA